MPIKQPPGTSGARNAPGTDFGMGAKNTFDCADPSDADRAPEYFSYLNKKPAFNRDQSATFGAALSDI